MLKRTVSGAVYVAIIAGFFLLRQLIDYRLFNILSWVLCSLATVEVARAIKDFLFGGNFILSIIYGVLFVPIFCVFQWTLNFGRFACLGLFGVFFVFEIIYSIVKKVKFKIFTVNILPFIYPSLLILSLLLSNEFTGIAGYLATLIIFVVPPCVDTVAYLVGSLCTKLRKGNVKKMCPDLSPNKTWIGAIGGLFGGMIGALIIVSFVTPETIKYSPVFPFIILIAIIFIFSELDGIFEYLAIIFTVVLLVLIMLPRAGDVSIFIFFISLGLLISGLTVIGDLFESYIKRKVGIKDMGNIMPGHGGIMDRIDGMLFACVGTYFAFSVIIIT